MSFHFEGQWDQAKIQEPDHHDDFHSLVFTKDGTVVATTTLNDKQFQSLVYCLRNYACRENDADQPKPAVRIFRLWNRTLD